jgi:hypothetical protein
VTPISTDDHAKVKPSIPDNTSKHACFQICTNQKSAIDHSTGTPGAFLVIDTFVKLTEDTPGNEARELGKAASLKSKVTGKETLVSRNGGVPFAVLQLEPWNPSTPTQKLNNLHQLYAANHNQLDS